LKKCEIAKSVKDGAAILVRAVLNDYAIPGTDYNNFTNNTDNNSNDPMENYPNNSNIVDVDADADADTDHEISCGGGGQLSNQQRWDDIYPNGSVVGAKSGTGGPLCEQTRLIYNESTNRVGIVDVEVDEIDDNNDNNDDDNNDSGSGMSNSNFLGNTDLQRLVYDITQEFVVE